MNYLKQINTFFELLLSNPLSANAQCLYFNLLNINNKCNWLEEFTTANSTLMGFTNLNKQALYRARNELIQRNLIEFKKGINQNQSGRYKIIEFVTADNTADDTAHNTADDTPDDTADDTNNKLNKTKQKKKKVIKKKKTFEDVFIENCFSEELEKTIKDFIDMRKTIKKPMTTKALELLIKNLEGLTNLEEEKIAILNQSIEHGWQSVYPLKSGNLQNKPKNSKPKNAEFVAIDTSDLTPEEYSKLVRGEITTKQLIEEGRIHV